MDAVLNVSCWSAWRMSPSLCQKSKSNQINLFFWSKDERSFRVHMKERFEPHCRFITLLLLMYRCSDDKDLLKSHKWSELCCSGYQGRIMPEWIGAVCTVEAIFSLAVSLSWRAQPAVRVPLTPISWHVFIFILLSLRDLWICCDVTSAELLKGPSGNVFLNCRVSSQDLNLVVLSDVQEDTGVVVAAAVRPLASSENIDQKE